MQEDSLPHWDLSNVYPGLDSSELKQDISGVKDEILALAQFMSANGLSYDGVIPDGAAELADVMGQYVSRVNQIILIYSTVRAYISSFISTNSYDDEARKMLSELELVGLMLEERQVQFKGWMRAASKDEGRFESALISGGPAQDHAFFLKETAQQSRYLMSEAEESLASELALSGSRAWAKLQGVVGSRVKAQFESNGQVKALPITVIQNFYNDRDESIRHQAYEVELKAWESVSEPMAAALNGIKGAVNTLSRRRGRPDSLQGALEQARIDPDILEAMLSAMRDSFPDFRRYWHKKAKLLGKERLPWWDLNAPVGDSDMHFTYAEAREFILDHFASFSPRLVEFTRRAFDRGWIDAEPRDGKRAGAFCMSILRQNESRIFCNFDGSMDSVSTLAHELGHAYHNECHQAMTPLQRRTPMTLAETASIFNQTIITNAALKEANDASQRLVILESFMADSAQVCVDIYSRFLFEREVFERRQQAELSAADLCDLMIRFQKETYGDGLDNNYLHPYMWAWKPHYYNPNRSFYNFPYAFGLLFGLGLFSIYQTNPEGFLDAYDELLADSGSAYPAELAARFGIDLRRKAFWQQSLDIIRERIDRYGT